MFVAVSFLCLSFATNDVGLIWDYLGRMFDLFVVLELPYGARPHLRYALLAGLMAFFCPNSYEMCLGGRKKVWLLFWASFLIVASIPTIF